VLGQTPPDFDLECPLISLPAALGTTVQTVPWSGAYLGADPEIADQKLVEFPAFGTSLRVGIAWAGNPRYKADSQRSTHLKTLLPLLQMPGVTWISLQKGDAAEQSRSLPGNVVIWDGCSLDRDLADAAALVATLDLVITTDTCIAHLAGAMGKPVWILLPHFADWRWMERTGATPWYPTARLIRQTKPGDWNGVVQRAIGGLTGFCRAHRRPPINHPHPSLQPSPAWR
jgi:Glycosyltransferase family 9 (heptosyltransferase)